MFTGFLKGLLEDSSDNKEEKSDSHKRKPDAVEFDVKPEELSLVTIPGNSMFLLTIYLEG